MNSSNEQQPSKYVSPWPHGIIKRWDDQRHFGIIYAPEGKWYYVHISKVIEGQPELFRKVTFDIGAARSPQELEQALNVRVGEMVGSSK